MRHTLKQVVTAITITTMAAVTTISALADDVATPDVKDMMETSFKSISSDITSTIMTVLPIALGILGLTIAIRFGIRWFKSLTGGR